MITLGELVRSFKTPRRTDIVFPKDKETSRITLSQMSDKLPTEYNRYEIESVNITDDGKVQLYIK